MARRRHEEHEEHENHERWLVSYADMVTLLMVLFIVMFAMSQVDQKKFNQVKEGLAAGFGNESGILSGSNAILEEPGTAPAGAVAPVPVDLEGDPAQAEVVGEAVAAFQQRGRERRAAAAAVEAARLGDVQARVERALERAGLEGDVRADVTDRGLVLSLVSRHVVFAPDVAELSPRGRRVVDTLAPVLADLPDPLSIEGHTNQVDVKPKYFPTDWELSAARAVGVLRYLVDRHDLSAERLVATAYGHEKPLVDPAEPGSQRINKRVDIVVQTSLPSDVSAQLEEQARAARNTGDRP